MLVDPYVAVSNDDQSPLASLITVNPSFIIHFWRFLWPSVTIMNHYSSSFAIIIQHFQASLNHHSRIMNPSFTTWTPQEFFPLERCEVQKPAQALFEFHRGTGGGGWFVEGGGDGKHQPWLRMAGSLLVYCWLFVLTYQQYPVNNVTIMFVY